MAIQNQAETDQTINNQLPRHWYHMPGFLLKLSHWLRKRLDYLQPSEDVVLVITAVVVGFGTGLGAVIFHYLIELVEWVGFDVIPHLAARWGYAYVVVVPTVGGLLTGILVYRFAREAKGHGVPEVMVAMALRGGRIRPVVAIVKAIASALTIGSGGSAGTEGPIVQIGSALGSTVGQLLHLSDDRVRNLVACGAAGGIAAVFNAPIAGVLFALEVIIGSLSMRYMSTVVISAVVASVVSRVVFGNTPAFPLPVEYGITHLWEYGYYLILGVLIALMGVAYVRVLYWTEDLFEDWKRPPEWLKPAIGGALLGILALVYPIVTGFSWMLPDTPEPFLLHYQTMWVENTAPDIFGVGYTLIENVLANNLALTAVLILMVLKLITTSLTLGSGGSGGVFAPGLFMGAMLGSAFAQVVGSIAPDSIGPAGAYALVGMGALFAASAHAPMTAIIMLMELTDDYRIILPLMLTVTVSTVLARRMLGGESIYTLKLTRRGIRLMNGQDMDLMQGVLVKEAMQAPAPTIDSRASLFELKEKLRELNIRALCIVDQQQHLRGIVTLGDLQRVFQETMASHPADLNQLIVGDICTHQVVTVYSDDPLFKAVRTMGTRDIGRMPVLQTGTNKLVGMLSRHNIMDAYNLAVTRKLREQHQYERMRLNVLTGAHVFEMRVGANAPIAGETIGAVAWPEESLVAAIRRKGKLVVPHGYSVIQPGDDLTIVAEPKAEEQLNQLFGDTPVHEGTTIEIID